jgi:serine phosphatase RsbU (regulator of sigma subunit)
MRSTPSRSAEPSHLRVAREESAAVDLLVEAGAVLASSLDPTVTMRHVAELTVPRLADLCVIDLRDETGAIRDVAVVARDPEVERGLLELRAERPVEPDSRHPVARAIRLGEPQLLTEMTPPLLRSFARGSRHAEFMIAHRYRSAITAPLLARGRTLGALSVLRLGDSKGFEVGDLDVVCELARRAALAIDNARLFSDLRRLERRLEAILDGLAEAVTVVDEHGRTVFANQAAATLLCVDSPSELTNAAPGSIMGRFLVLDEQGRELELAQMPARRLFLGERPEPLLVRNIVRATGEERWIIARASPIIDPDTNRVTYAANVFEDITEVKRAERSERLLAETSRVLAASPDYAQTLVEVARLAVPQLADWCAVDILTEDGAIERVTLHHADEAKPELASRLGRRPPPTIRDSFGVGAVIGTGRTWSAHARGEEDLGLLREVGAGAMIIVPMLAGARVVGAITLASSESVRRPAEADLVLAEELGRRAGTAVENARAYTERARIAHTLQQALLPHSLPDDDGVEVHALYDAAGELNEVGGDFYDVLELDDGRWLLAIGDVCGKGPRAAGDTALARHTLRAAAISGQAPAAMLSTLHQAIRRQPSTESQCTACVVMMERRHDHARLTVALGGHQPPLVINAEGDAVAVGRTGTLLGAVDPIEVHEIETELRVGDTLLLYTDGVTDAGRSRDRLGELGLRRLCADAPRLTLPKLLESIKAAALEHAGATPRDDIMLLALRLRAGVPT